MSQSPAALVTEGTQLKAQIKAATARLKDIETTLIEQGTGDYLDPDGHKAQVIQPSDSFVFPDDAGEQALVREISGGFFGKLFEKVTTQKPVKAFQNVATAVLGKRELTKILKLCSKSKSAYVKWS